MEKLKMHSPDLVNQNIDKIGQMFPNCITESTDGKGAIKRSIDFDLLRQELSTHIVDGAAERYHLNWPGKKEALLTANAPIAKTLRPCREESVNFDTTQNLFIEGDNLDALKLLQETYLGKVKMIYIDPPYNTGNDFIYEDDFAEDTGEYLVKSNQKDELGNRLIANTDANGRFHSDWLSMMYSRLKLARNLLRDDGVIFISIDDGEVCSLRKICDEIFGEESFIAQFVWRCRKFTDARSVKNVSTDHEYILSFGKTNNIMLRGRKRDETKYSNPDNDPRGLWMSRSILGLATIDQRPNLHYPIVDPSTGISYSPPANTGWRYAKDRMEQLVNEQAILFPSKSTGRPREKKFRKDIQNEYTSFPTLIDEIHTSDGTQNLRELFETQIFDFPKPYQLLQSLIEQSVGKNDIVVDFFAGSCAMAEAVMHFQKIENIKVQYILVQLPEPCEENSEAFKTGFKTIADIGKERIRRAGKKILEELSTSEKKEKEKNPGQENLFSSSSSSTGSKSPVAPTTSPSSLDIGFRVLKVADSNMADIFYTPDAIDQSQVDLFAGNIKPGRTSEDLLFQVLLDWGVDLTLPITKETINNLEVFFVDTNALAACFVRNGEVTEEFCKELAKRQPLRVVFRDEGFANDSVKINVEQIFKLMSPHSDVKTI